MTTSTQSLAVWLLEQIAEDEMDASRRAKIKLIVRASLLPGRTFDQSRRVVRLLALPYADREGYREEWAV